MENSLTEGIRQLLYGCYKSEAVVERFERDDRGLCHILRSVPDTPERYLELDPSLAQRWEEQAGNKFLEKWVLPFYRLPDRHGEEFHILCRFYRSLVHCEFRMLFQVTESWVDGLTLTLIKYELLSLRSVLLEYLKECNGRIQESAPDSGSLSSKLHGWLITLLRSHLLMAVLELESRYEHLLAEDALTTDEIFLQHLEQPVPQTTPWHPTVACTRFRLEKALRPPGSLNGVEKLLRNCELQRDHQNQEAKRSLHILENAWLITLICVKHGGERPFTAADPDANAARLQGWRKVIRNLNDDHLPDEEVKHLHVLLEHLPDICAVLKPYAQGDSYPQGFLPGVNYAAETNTGCSEAVLLLWEVKDIFDPAAGSDGVVKRSSKAELTRGSSETHPLLREYIPISEIIDKLNVSDKTFKKYLRQAEVPIIQFSNKSKWMHKDHFRAFMNLHQQQNN